MAKVVVTQSICKWNCPPTKCKTGIWNCPKCPDRTREEYYIERGA